MPIVAVAAATIIVAATIAGLHPTADHSRELSLRKEADRLWVDALKAEPLTGGAMFLSVPSPVHDIRGHVAVQDAPVLVRNGATTEHLQPRFWLSSLTRPAEDARVLAMSTSPDGGKSVAIVTWKNGSASGRGIVVLRNVNGDLDATRIIDVVAADVAAGPNGTIVAITRASASEPWVITAFDEQGRKLGEGLRPDHVQKPYSVYSTLEWMNGDTYSYFDAAHDRVTVFSVRISNGSAAIVPVRMVDISAPPPRTTTSAYVLGAHVRPDNTVEVVRSIPGAEVPLTSVSMYATGQPAKHWIIENGTRYCFWQDGAVHLLTNDDETGEPVLRSLKFQ